MKPTHVARLLLLVLALILGMCLAFSQGVTQLPDRPIFRGNPYTFSLVLASADSALVSTAVLYYDKNGRIVETPNQPTVSRAGRTLILSWNVTSTLPERAWLEIRAGGVTRFVAWVVTNKNPTIIMPPGSLTVISPIADGGSGIVPGSTSRIYNLANTPNSGYVVTHNRANRLVKATFFREDTGLADPLWRLSGIQDNSVTLGGPPGETFTGKLELEFSTQTNN